MIRAMSVFTALAALLCMTGSAEESGKCTIVNTSREPVVIGLYRPSSEGIDERLINVPPKATLHSIPIELTEDEQFVVAYRASIDEKPISRALPIRVDGHKRMRRIAKRSDLATPHVLIVYRGGIDPHWRHRDDLHSSLYLTEMEIEAQRILRDANQTTTTVETPRGVQPSNTGSGDEAGIQGRWEEVLVRRGTSLEPPSEEQAAAVMTFGDGKTTRTVVGIPVVQMYSLDPSQTPKHIDITGNDNGKQVTVEGVYDVKRNVLIVKLSQPGHPRPKNIGFDPEETGVEYYSLLQRNSVAVGAPNVADNGFTFAAPQELAAGWEVLEFPASARLEQLIALQKWMTKNPRSHRNSVDTAARNLGLFARAIHLQPLLEAFPDGPVREAARRLKDSEVSEVIHHGESLLLIRRIGDPAAVPGYVLGGRILSIQSAGEEPRPGAGNQDGYQSYWLTDARPAKERGYGPKLMLSRAPIGQFDDCAGQHGEASAAARSIPLLDQPALLIETYWKDSIWNADGRPIKPLAVVQRVNEASGEITIDGRDYRFEPCPLAEVIQLLENPEGTIPLHRAHAPLAGARQTARALALLIKEQLQKEKGTDARSSQKSPRRKAAIPNGAQNAPPTGAGNKWSGEPRAAAVSLDDGVYAVVSLEHHPHAEPQWTVVLPAVPVEGSESGEPGWIVLSIEPLLRFKSLSQFDFTFEKNVCTQIGFQNTDELKAYTRDHVGARLAVVVDNRVITHHKIREPITSSGVRITCCTTGGGDHVHKHLKELKLATESDRAAGGR